MSRPYAQGYAITAGSAAAAFALLLHLLGEDGAGEGLLLAALIASAMALPVLIGTMIAFHNADEDTDVSGIRLAFGLGGLLLVVALVLATLHVSVWAGALLGLFAFLATIMVVEDKDEEAAAPPNS